MFLREFKVGDILKKFYKFIITIVLFISIISLSFIRVEAIYNSSYLTMSIPTGYYDDLDTTKTGEEFRRDLSTIISKGYVKHNYSTNNTVLPETDPDPNKPGNIICLYTGQSLSSGSWNKEHVWAKSHGFPSEGATPYSDAHHLRPTQNLINSYRANSDFGEVDGLANVKTDGYGNKWTNSIFEPRDEVKGDVARMMFYMATRYGFDGTYNLTLVSQDNTSASDNNGKFGNLDTLLKWHYQDPVSDAEIYRNNVIYKDWQKNRNPYIDHPEYVDLAYPNQYSNNEVNQEQVNLIISQINDLSDLITLEDKPTVMAIKALYDALNYTEKALVTNYSMLLNAIKTIESLEGNTNPGDSDDPIIPSDSDIIIDFSSHNLSDTGYTNSFSFEIDGYEFKSTSGGVFSDELRLGGNKDNYTEDLSRFNINDNGVALEAQFNVSNAKSITIVPQLNYGTVSKYYILFKEVNSSNYTLVKEANFQQPITTPISASLSEAKDGNFVFIFTGSTPRLVLNSITIGVEELPPVVNPPVEDPTDDPSNVVDYSKYNLTTSVKGEMANNEITSLALRFGGRFESDVFKDANKFGVIVMLESELGQKSIADLYKDNNISTMSSINGYSSLIQEFTSLKALVNENGAYDANGGYYQFGLVITNILGHENVKFVACIYVETDDGLYFTNEVKSTYIEALQLALNSNDYDENSKKIMQEVLKKY